MTRNEIAVKILCAMLSNSWLQKEFNKDLKTLKVNQYNKLDFMRKWHIEAAFKWADEIIANESSRVVESVQDFNPGHQQPYIKNKKIKK